MVYCVIWLCGVGAFFFFRVVFLVFLWGWGVLYRAFEVGRGVLGAFDRVFVAGWGCSWCWRGVFERCGGGV